MNLIKCIAIKCTFILHRQNGAPIINIQSPLGTAPDLCKNVSLQCYLVATVIHVQALRRQTCVYVHILFIMQRQQSVKRNKKNWTAVNNACHTLVSSYLGYIPDAIYGILARENFAIREQIKVETSAGHKTPGAFHLLISLHFKCMNSFKENEKRVFEMLLCMFYRTHSKLRLCLCSNFNNRSSLCLQRG
jgi:hypothetical protein